MSISSFDKMFILDSKKAVESFMMAISYPAESVRIDRGLTSPMRIKQGKNKLKQMLIMS